MFTIRGQIEWEAIRYADDFYFPGGNTGCSLLLEGNYKPQLIRPAWFWQFDRLYESKGRSICVRWGWRWIPCVGRSGG